MIAEHRREESDPTWPFSGTEAQIDQALGFGSRDEEDRIHLLELLDRYGPRFLEPGDLPWSLIQEYWARIITLGVRTLLDLGSGFGRFVIYGAMNHGGVHVTGIEIVHERVQEARRVQSDLGLTNVSFRQGDATRTHWPPAECVCVLNSLTPSERDVVLPRLHRMAARTEFFLASLSTSNLVFFDQPWLEAIDPTVRTCFGMQVFRARSPGTLRP